MRTDPTFAKLMRELHPEVPPRRERGDSRATIILRMGLSTGAKPVAWMQGWLVDLGISPRAAKAARRQLEVEELHDAGGHPVWRSNVAEDRRWRSV